MPRHAISRADDDCKPGLEHLGGGVKNECRCEDMWYSRRGVNRDGEQGLEVLKVEAG